jgi:surface protein
MNPNMMNQNAMNMNPNMMKINQPSQNMKYIEENIELTGVIKKILIQIGDISKLIDSKNKDKLSDLITKISSKNKDYKIDEISTLINSELDVLKNYIIDGKNGRIHNNDIYVKYYTHSEGIYDIFGTNFVNNNKNNIELIINGKKSQLTDNYRLSKGENVIKLIINNDLTNLEYMFYECKNLVNIDGLNNLDTSHVTNYSFLFYECSSLKNIDSLYYWNVKNSTDFSYMFYNCTLINDLSPLKKWNVPQCLNFSYMFYGCISLIDLAPLEYWNVSKLTNVEAMFWKCPNITKKLRLGAWDISLTAYERMYKDYQASYR